MAKNLGKNFNSIKVRLKHSDTIYIALFVLYFNSIKVRLKPGVAAPLGFATIFQFHKGTIKTCARHTFATMMLTHFNSIKVRLKPLSLAEKGRSSSFQFHKGTIKTLPSARALNI